MSYNIYVPKTVYMDENITDYDLMMYCVLQPFYSLPLSEGAIVSLDTVRVVVYGDADLNWKQKKEPKESIERLIEAGVLNGRLIPNVGTVYKFDRYELPEYYAAFDYNAVQMILRSDHKAKYALLRYFCVLVGSFSNSIHVQGKTNIIGTQKLSYYASLLHVDERTIMRYNSALEEMKLIYILHTSGDSEHDFQTFNVYGRYEDRDLVDQYANTRSIPQEKANNNRAVSQKYNAFVKAGGNGYSYEERLRLYQQCKSYNAEMDRLHEERPGGGYLKRKKDLSVFNLEDDEIFE